MHMDTSDHGPRAVTYGFTGIKSVLKCVFIFSCSCTTHSLTVSQKMFVDICQYELFFFGGGGGELTPEIRPSILDTLCLYTSFYQYILVGLHHTDTVCSGTQWYAYIILTPFVVVHNGTPTSY